MKTLSKISFPADHKSIASNGTRGKCRDCNRLKQFTANISGSYYCSDCVQKRKTPSHGYSNNGFYSYTTGRYDPPKFEPSDAKFKCPVGACTTDLLSFGEYFVGSCCEEANKWQWKAHKYESLSIVSKEYEIAREEEGSAEKVAEDADKALEDAKKKSKDAHEALDQKKIWRKKVQKRHLFLSTEAMKEDNDELEDMVVVKQAKLDDKLKCKVCLENYDDNHPQVILITCGHHFCSPCVAALQQKNCPTCRTRFTPAKILKVFD